MSSKINNFVLKTIYSKIGLDEKLKKLQGKT
jgi:hypothetical protein